MLFRFRFLQDDSRERRAFIESLNLNWEAVGDEERHELADRLLSGTSGLRRVDEESWYKVDWESVPELVERRAVFLAKGKAYVPGREQLSIVLAEFSARLERALEVWIPRICLFVWFLAAWSLTYCYIVDKSRPTTSGRG